MIAADSAPFSLGGRAAAWAGGLAVLAMSVFLVGMLISQLLTPGYSVITDDMSSLGKTPGAGAVVYNLSVVLSGSGLTAFGALAFCASRRQPANVLVSLMLCALGLAVLIGGVFPEGTQVHLQVGYVAFVLSGLTALASYTVQRGWPAYLSAIVGTTTLAMVILTVGNVSLPVADGIKERMTLYPIFRWELMLGARLFLAKNRPGTSGRTASVARAEPGIGVGGQKSLHPGPGRGHRSAIPHR